MILEVCVGFSTMIKPNGNKTEKERECMAEGKEKMLVKTQN